jgi:glycopeptide antibiotics resistance protein
VIKNKIKNGRKELREFGITLAIVFGLFGALLWWRHKPYFCYLLFASGFFAFFGLLLPTVLKPIHKVWMGLALILGSIMTRVILSVLFYLVITPISIICRLSGKDILDLKIDKAKKSYWIKREKSIINKSRYEKQY